MPTLKLKQGSRRLAIQANQRAQQQQHQQQQKQQHSPDQTIERAPTIVDLEAKRDALKGLLAKVDKQVLDLENRYVRSANPLGTAVTGYEGFITGMPVPSQDMRIFSGCSTTPLPQLAPRTEASDAPAAATAPEKPLDPGLD